MKRRPLVRTSMTILPSGVLSADTSKKTFGLLMMSDSNRDCGERQRENCANRRPNTAWSMEGKWRDNTYAHAHSAPGRAAKRPFTRKLQANMLIYSVTASFRRRVTRQR